MDNYCKWGTWIATLNVSFRLFGQSSRLNSGSDLGFPLRADSPTLPNRSCQSLQSTLACDKTFDTALYQMGAVAHAQRGQDGAPLSGWAWWLGMTRGLPSFF